MVGFWIALVVAIIAATILLGIYMYYCAENDIELFEPKKHGERISNLEKKIEILKKEIEELRKKI